MTTPDLPVLNASELEIALDKNDPLFLGILICRNGPGIQFGNEWVFIEPGFLGALVNLDKESRVEPCKTAEEWADYVIQTVQNQTSRSVSEFTRLLIIDGFRDFEKKLEDEKISKVGFFIKSKDNKSNFILLVEIETELSKLKRIMALEKDDISNL